MHKLNEWSFYTTTHFTIQRWGNGVIIFSLSAVIYRPRNPQLSDYYRYVEVYFETFIGIYDEHFSRQYGFWWSYLRQVLNRYLDCGDLHKGFARSKKSQLQVAIIISIPNWNLWTREDNEADRKQESYLRLQNGYILGTPSNEKASVKKRPHRKDSILLAEVHGNRTHLGRF